MRKNLTPLIGVTVDYQKSGEYSDYPWYALRANYSNAINQAGGCPIFIPYEHAHIEYYINLIDGLVISGGYFDIDPSYYQETKSSDSVIINDHRTSFEVSLTKGMLALDKPVLGICAGHQLLNVIFGGSLIQHIPDSIPNALEHEQSPPKHLPHHKIEIKQGTMLAKIVQTDSYMVNSTHHQAVKEVGKDIIINSVAPDGVIEGIEHTKHKFCLGVEWHPEHCQSDEDKKIFSAFVESCKAN